MSEQYNAEYYHRESDIFPYDEPAHWIDFFGHVADRIVSDLKPNTVLDAGCAMGYLVAALRDRGVEAYGVDISEYAISRVREDVRPYCVVGSLTDPLPEALPQRYDLVVTIEVLEHLSEEDGKKAIQNLCSLSDSVLFSSTPDDFMERTHVNVQQREYWARMFADCDFYDDLAYRPVYLTYHAVLFKSGISQPQRIDAYERFIRQTEAELKQTQEELNNAINELAVRCPGKNCTAHFYFNTKEGYVEENVVSYVYDSARPLEHTIHLPDNCSSIRFDPVEGHYCLVKIFDVISDRGAVTCRNINGEAFGEVFCFSSTDPQLEFVFEHPAQWIRLLVGVCVFDDPLLLKLVTEMRNIDQARISALAQLEALCEENTELNKSNAELNEKNTELNKSNAELNEKNTELNKSNSELNEKNTELNEKIAELLQYKESYSTAIKQRDEVSERVNELEYELSSAENAFLEVTNSASWKMTKPIRVLLDSAKKIPPIALAINGLKSLKDKGIVYTSKKHTEKLHTEESIPQPLPEQLASKIDGEIKFSILTPLYNTPEQFLRDLIESVRAQYYQNWELCLVDASDSEHKVVEAICRQYMEADKRICYQRITNNGGISANTNLCAQMATGDYLALLDHDDLLSPDALSTNANAILETKADVLYSDEDHLSIEGTHINPLYKPDWSPDLLNSQMYICHFLVFRRELFEEVGGFISEFDGSQDYDLMLRFSEKTDRICHIPRILYTWRESQNSTAASADAKPYAHEAGRRALDAHLKRVYGESACACDGEQSFVYDARFSLDREPKVSIIIPMRDKHELTEQCIRSIEDMSTYSNYEILILDNRSAQDETLKWLEEIKECDEHVRVLTADMDFNWSALNNYAVEHSDGDILVFLNNDTLVISKDWLERIVENVTRKDIGCVGALLLYPDNTIQHAGIVVGMGGWADHVFKGMAPVHYGSPFVSPVVSRNVLAVTGACMAISRKRLMEIGLFDEEFIICGSDVELCIRAYEKGYRNLYDAHIKLYHLESKSRDSYIPEIDFIKSAEAYSPYRDTGDPFYNVNLNNASAVPTVCIANSEQISYQNYLLVHKEARSERAASTESLTQPASKNLLPQIVPITGRRTAWPDGLRLNLLIPSLRESDVFGGIATALRMFEALQTACGCPARIITMDAPFSAKDSKIPLGYSLVSPDRESTRQLQIVSFNNRLERSIPVAAGDVFLATIWWSAYNIQDTILWQKEEYGKENPLLYMIQDYEPGFYSWSSCYAMAESTYSLKIPTYAIINSSLLNEYLGNHKHRFAKKWCFEPILNPSLKRFLPISTSIQKKKQILVYGRPGTDRNAFTLLIYALTEWVHTYPAAKEWTLLSAGESFEDVALENNVILHSVGKLSLEEYATVLQDSYAGISLMISPHPSYPPLEMATFGVRTITNCFANKDLSGFSDNIISLPSASPKEIAATLCEVCQNYTAQGHISCRKDYVERDSEFGDIPKEIVDVLKQQRDRYPCLTNV